MPHAKIPSTSAKQTREEDQGLISDSSEVAAPRVNVSILLYIMTWIYGNIFFSPVTCPCGNDISLPIVMVNLWYIFNHNTSGGVMYHLTIDHSPYQSSLALYIQVPSLFLYVPFLFPYVCVLFHSIGDLRSDLTCWCNNHKEVLLSTWTRYNL